MKKNGYIETPKTEIEVPSFKGYTIKDLGLKTAITVPAAIAIVNAIEIMKSNGFDQLPVTAASDSKHCVGLVTLGGLLAKIGSGRVKLNDAAEIAMYKFKIDKKFTEFTMETPLEKLTKFFETHSSAVVTRKSDVGELLIVSVVTKVDLLSFLLNKAKV
jgi:cystathionine beta-synthase